jgi:hypothetical protein
MQQDSNLAPSLSTTHDTNTHNMEKQSNFDQDTQSGKIEPHEGPGSSGSRAEAEFVGFDGPIDSDNPYNWTKSKKWAHGGILSVMSFLT